MDEFISIDEALEILFDKAAMDDKQKLKRLFQYYSREKVHFYVELLVSNDIYARPIREYKPKDLMDAVFAEVLIGAVNESNGYKVPEVKLLEGHFKLDRNLCGGYLKALQGNYEQPRTNFHETDSVVDLLGKDGRVWRIIDFANISCVHFSPDLDDILIRSEQISGLTQAIKPQKKPHKRTDISEKSNKTKMEVLGAALSVLAQFRPQCVSGEGVVQGAKVAKVMEEKAGLFWPETNQAPQEPEVLRKTINEWLSKSR